MSPNLGLFHGAIIHSGSAFDTWALDQKPKEAARYIATYLNCPIDEDKALFECVVQKDANDLVKAGSDLIVGGIQTLLLISALYIN